MAKTERQFNIAEVIEQKIAKKDVAFFDNLEDWQIRQIPPFMLMKWMGAARNKNQIKLTNDIANTLVFSLYNHPKLLYKVLMACNTGGRPGWVKRPPKAKESEKLKVIKEYHDCTLTEAQKYLPLFEDNDIIEMAEAIGIDKETLTKLKKELNGK